MLEVLRTVSGTKSSEAIQSFLEQMLVEVVAGNYRHSVHENLHRSWNGDREQAELRSSPPLLASERVLSGLFSNAFSSLSPVFWPEQPVKRLLEQDEAERESAPRSGAGRTDFLALYNARLIGVEVKRANVAKAATTQGHKDLNVKWQAVRSQAENVIQHMRSLPNEYRLPPVAVGLLVIRVQTRTKILGDAERRGKLESRALSTFEELKRALATRTGNNALLDPAPRFAASYLLPQHMCKRTLAEGKGTRICPGVLFAASVHER